MRHSLSYIPYIKSWITICSTTEPTPEPTAEGIKIPVDGRYKFVFTLDGEEMQQYYFQSKNNGDLLEFDFDGQNYEYEWNNENKIYNSVIVNDETLKFYENGEGIGYNSEDGNYNFEWSEDDA